jgi:adenosine deaminase
VQNITKTSRGDLIAFARIITWFDFIFIIFYTGLVVMLSNRAQRESRPWLNTLLRLNIFLVVVLALLDITENSFLLYDLKYWQTNFINVWWITWLKYILVQWIIAVLIFSWIKRTVIAAIVVIALFLLILFFWFMRDGQSEKDKASAFTHHYFESIRNNEAALTSFFSEMPKGGDLHHHYSGSVYAETFLDIAIQKKYWINTQSLKIIADPPLRDSIGKYKRIDTLTAKRDFYELKQRLFQQWSVKDYYDGYEPSDKHFFDAFLKFPPYKWKETGEGLRGLRERAIEENVKYIETMLTGIDCNVMISEQAHYDSLLRMSSYNDSNVIHSYLDKIRNELFQKGLPACSHNFIDSLKAIHQQYVPDDSLFIFRYLTYSNRNSPPVRFFRDLLLAFESANSSDLIVGVNILAPEDRDISMRDYRLHMYMFNYCHRLYDSVKYSMHAGELTMNLVKPEDLTFHIRDAVYVAGAKRIGHGVDLNYEDDYSGLLDYMSKKDIAIEINLVSNEFILKVNGDEHPIGLYKTHKVPIVISTDDVGILRSDLTHQFVLLAKRYPEISYEDIKTFINNSIRYSFIKDDKIKERLLKDISRDIQSFETKIMKSNPN